MTEPGDDTPRQPPAEASELPPVEPPSTSDTGWRPTPLWYMAEIIVVVVGVIIALAADAWWGGRQEAALEAEVLSAVRTELETNRAELGDILDVTDDCLDRTDRFLRAESSSFRAVHDDSVFYWTSSLACRRTFEPATDAAQALSAAPGFNSVLDLRIRRAVAAWITALTDAAEERDAMSRYGDAVYQVLSGYVARQPEGGLDAFPTLPRLVARGGADRLAVLRRDTTLVERIILRAHYQQAYRQELQEALAAADTALAVLTEAAGG